MDRPLALSWLPISKVENAVKEMKRKVYSRRHFLFSLFAQRILYLFNPLKVLYFYALCLSFGYELISLISFFQMPNVMCQ